MEWLKKTKGTTLKGLDISEEMVALARKNARDYGMVGRGAEGFAGGVHKLGQRRLHSG